MNSHWTHALPDHPVPTFCGSDEWDTKVNNTQALHAKSSSVFTLETGVLNNLTPKMARDI